MNLSDNKDCLLFRLHQAIYTTVIMIIVSVVES